MTDLTPTQLAIARALVGDDWDKGIEYTDLGSRDTVVYLARAALAAARSLIEAEVRAELVASTVTTSTPLDGWTLHAEDGDVELTHDCPGWDRYGVVKCFDAAPLAEVVAAITEHTCPDPAARIAEGGERRG